MSDNGKVNTTPTVDITTDISAAISTYIEENVYSFQSSLCLNNINFSNLSGCTITGLDQSCSAQAFANVISESVTQAAIQRQVYQKLYENAVLKAQGILDQVVEYYMSMQFNEQAQREGAYQAFIEMGYSESEAAKLAEEGEAAPYAYNLVGQLVAQISLESNVRLNTRCARNADAINTMEMTNVTCTNGATINFASQYSTAQALGDCAVNGAISGSTDDTNLAADATVPVEMSPAMTKLSGYLTYISSSTALHGDTLPTACIMLTVFALLLLVLASYFARYSAPSKQERYTALALVLGLFVAAVVWYPGYFAVKKGMWPWPYPASQVSAGSDGKAMCVDGELSEKDFHVNKMVWQQTASCFSKDDDALAGTDDCSGLHHYATCGLFSGCDDANFQADQQAFSLASNACDRSPMGVTNSCSAMSVASAIYNGPYPGCSACEGMPFFVQEGQDCYDVNTSLLVYGGFGDVVGTDGQITSNGCSSVELAMGKCIVDKDDYEAAYPGECLSTAYHLRKKMLSNYLQGCIDVDATTAVSNPASVSLEEKCPPDPADYFDCDPDTELCNYTSVSAPAGKCANSFEDCDDPDYLADLRLDALLGYKCKAEYENWQKSNGWSSLYLTIGLYAAIVVVLAVLALRYQREQQPSLLEPLTEARTPFGIYLVALVLICLLIAASGPPFGLMGMAYGMSPLYGEDSTLTTDYPFIEDFGTTKGKAVAWFLVSLLALVFWLILFFQNRSLPSSMTEAGRKQAAQEQDAQRRTELVGRALAQLSNESQGTAAATQK